MSQQTGYFNWPKLMQAGLQGLGLHPSEFWMLTPAELQMMLGQFQVEPPMSRDRLSTLLDVYPDELRGTHD